MNYLQKLGAWLYRYKLYHIPFWMAYHFWWWSLGSNAVDAASNILYSPYSIKYLSYVILQAVGVYFMLYFLIPRYLEKGQYWRYLFYLIATILLTSALIVGGYFLSAAISGISFETLYKMPPSDWFHLVKTNALPSTVASMTLAMSIKLTKNWLQARQREQILEKENLNSELKFLRSQYNPHFLFNTINSIFYLIHKNPQMASDSLAQFSDLLRYQLYECNEPLIPLRKEMEYLDNFVELEKLRQEETLKIDCQIEIPVYGDLMIAPFLLIPFVENAFKHVSKLEQGNWISIAARVEERELILVVSNSISAAQNASSVVLDYGGIGLQNVKRRLDLLYPNHHRLSIQVGDTAYEVSLGIELQEQVLPNSLKHEPQLSNY
ncbi:MAG: histidine kinase [Bacteroidota bacterium]